MKKLLSVLSLVVFGVASAATPTIITVKQDGSGDFTKIADAVRSITDSSVEKPYVVQIHEGTYDMIAEFFGEEDYTDTKKVGLMLPNYVDLVGIGDKTKIVLNSDFPSTIKYRTSLNYSTLNLRGYNNRLENLTVTAYNCRYAVHDQSSALVNEMNYSHVYKDCVFIHKGYDAGCTRSTSPVSDENNNTTTRWSSSHAVGQGYNHGAYIYFENCVFDAKGLTGNAFLTHDCNTPQTGVEMLPGRVICYECTFHSVQKEIFYASSTGAGVNQYVEFYDCSFDTNKVLEAKISSLNTAASPGKGLFEYYLSGRGNSPETGLTVNVPAGYDDHKSVQFGPKQGRPTQDAQKGPIGRRRTDGVTVQEGECQKLATALEEDSGALFVKGGKGTLVMPEASLTAGSKILALDGSITFTRDAVTSSDDGAVPSVITDSAALWLSAKSAASIVEASGAVTEWHDVRDTDLENLRYPYAKHAVLSTYADQTQTVGTYLERTGVYFGGYAASGKGGYQKLVSKTGANLTICHAYDIFYVYGINDSNGTIFGDTDGVGKAFTTGSTFLDKVGGVYFYPRADSVGQSMAARHYRDGVRYDPFTEKTAAGTSLYEAEFLVRPARFNSFFAGHGPNASRQGGDYLHEVIVFTNRLTEVERMAVAKYLQKKWALGIQAKTGVPEIALGADATLELSNDLPGTYTNYTRVVVKGEGTVRTAGANEVAIQGAAFNDFRGALKVGAAPVFSRFENFPAVAVGSGECYDVSYRGSRTMYKGSTSAGWSPDRGVLMTKTAAASGELVKRGAEPMTIAALPSDVSSLKVEGGTLSIRGAMAARYASGGTGGIQAVFANPGCENVQYPASAVSSLNRVVINNSSWKDGWYHYVDSVHTGSAAYLQGRNFTAWGLVAPEGNQAIEMLTPGGAGLKTCIYTRVNFPVAGEYVVSWYEGLGYGQNLGAVGYEVRLALESAGWAKSVLVADRTTVAGDYQRVYQKVSVPAAGDYLFGFVLLGPCATFADKANYSALTIDDLRGDLQARTMADCVEVAIPNGDFEKTYNTKGATGLYTGNAGTMHDSVNFAEGWTFYQGDSWAGSGKAPVVGVVQSLVPRSQSDDGLIDGSGNAKNKGVSVYASNAGLDAFGSVKLFMANRPSDSDATAPGVNVGNYAQTTFTVAKKGTYYLRGKLAKWFMSYNGDCAGNKLFNIDPSVKATVTIGGVATDLGVRTSSTTFETDDVWPTPFTVASDNTSVTLKIGQEAIRAIAILDDFRLVSEESELEAESQELVTNGSFEEGSLTLKTDGGVSGVSGWSTGGAGATGFWWEKSNGAAYAYAPYDGLVVCQIKQMGAIFQRIDGLKKGRYRFSFATMTRLQGDANSTVYRENGIKVYLKKLNGSSEVGGEIPVLSKAACVSVNPCYEAVEFELAESGNYRLYVQGACPKETIEGTTYDRSAVVDGISLRRVVAAEKRLPDYNPKLRVSIAAGAKLNLDFKGEMAVGRLSLGGVPVTGVVSASTYPDYITGSGSISTSASGTLLLVH